MNWRGLASTLRQSAGSSLRNSCPSAGFQLNQKFFARSSSRRIAGGMLGETCSANTLFDMANPFGREKTGRADIPSNPPPSRVESDYFMGSGASTPLFDGHRRDGAADGEDRERGVEEQLAGRALG